MHQQQIILESSPAYILVCLILAFGMAFLLYRTTSYPWSKTWNRILFAFRTTLAFLLLFLLLGPIVRQINNLFEKPLVVIVYDNSASVKEASDTVMLKGVEQQLSSIR